MRLRINGEFVVGVVAVILGLIAGAIARAILPGRQGTGWLGALITGVLGALLGGVVASLWGIPTVLIGVVAVMLAATPLVWRTVAGSLVGAYELAADAG